MSNEKKTCGDCYRFHPNEKVRCSCSSVIAQIEKGLRIGQKTPACLLFISKLRKYISNIPPKETANENVPDRGQSPVQAPITGKSDG